MILRTGASKTVTKLIEVREPANHKKNNRLLGGYFILIKVFGVG
jgi:hypothetical protein